MTNKELTQIRESLSLTKKEFAEKIGATAMMVGRYEKGNCEIPENVAMTVKALVKPAEDDVASFIKGVRENLNVSKSAFAKLIGVSATMAGNYESGKNKPKDEILEKIKSLIDNGAAASEAQTATVPVDEKEEVAAPVDEEVEVAAPVDEKEEEAATVAEKKAEEPAPKKKKSIPAKKKEESSALIDEKKPVSVEKKVSIVIESKMGGSITTEEVLSRLPDGVDTVYIKSEENAAYWVKGEESGSIELW